MGWRRLATAAFGILAACVLAARAAEPAVPAYPPRAAVAPRTSRNTSCPRFGYAVRNVANGREALAVAAEHGGRIDLLVTDVVMPEMNGRILAEALASVHPETKVLFTSGYAEDVIVHHGVLDKGVFFLAKPYTPEEMLKKVREVLDGGK